jgi:hypothetical protein
MDCLEDLIPGNAKVILIPDASNADISIFSEILLISLSKTRHAKPHAKGRGSHRIKGKGGL